MGVVMGEKTLPAVGQQPRQALGPLIQCPERSLVAPGIDGISLTETTGVDRDWWRRERDARPGEIVGHLATQAGIVHPPDFIVGIAGQFGAQRRTSARFRDDSIILGFREPRDAYIGCREVVGVELGVLI